MSEQYKDLGITQDKDGDYFDVVIPDLDFETDYAIQAAWIYSDKTLGTSQFSDRLNFTTPDQGGLLSPRFILDDLYAINSILYIKWNGKDSSGAEYLDSILKQVNVWIKGGDFGTEFVQYATSFTKTGSIQINATKKATYCVKLQAESKSGKFSLFSNEFCVTMLKQPKAVYDVRHSWDVSGNLSLFWKFDPTFKDATNDNTLADSFGLQMLDETNDVDATWWTAVEKEKLPPLEQKITISANQLQKVFGQFTAFEIDYASFIYVRDKNLQTSLVTGYALTKYSDPLTAPVISAVKAPMAYNVSYTSNSAFDKIYIEESTDSGVTWSSTPFVTSSNPAYIATTNSSARLVRAKFSKKLGGFTGYSNIVTVTPDKIDPTDTTAPSNPTNVSATAAVDKNDKTGFSLQATISFTKSSDADCRGYRVRWTTQTEDEVYEYGYVDHPLTGSTVSFTVSGLIPNTTYYYQVASVDQFNNTQSYTTAGTFIAQDSTATAEGSLARLRSYMSIGGATGDLFKFGTGILDSINTSITTTPDLSAAPVTGYHGILLNKTGNKNNYWLTTGQIRVGTDSQFMYFNGTDLYLTGDINARSGKISGNLTITNGGSFIARTADNALNKVTLNHLGLFAYDSAGTETTQIISNAAVGSPTFTTTKALVGNWSVGTNTISAGGVTLNSSTPSIIATNGGSYVGVRPRQAAGTDIVLWTGNTATPAVNSAASGQAGFQVNANGQLYATGAIISGVITVESGSSLGGLLNDTSKVYYSASTPSTPAGGFKVGDSWVDTSANNVLKVWSGTDWVIAQDSEAARSVAASKTKTTYGPTEPSSPITGDIWFDTNTGVDYFKVYNNGQWVRMKDSDITAAGVAAGNAQAAADSKSTTTSSATAPVSPKAGDVWFDTNFNYFKVWSTSVTPYAWVRMKDADITAAAAAAAAAAENAGQALNKAALFGIDASLVSNLIIKNSGAAIYSQYVSSGSTISKSSYGSSSAGFYLGWDNQSGVLYPAFDVGNSNAYLRYSSYTQALEVKGAIKATSGAFEGNVTAGAGAITIGPSGISTTSGKFSIDTSGNAFFSGTLQAGTILSNGEITGSTITGSTITTAGSGFGKIRLNSSINTLEFLTDTDSVGGALYQFNGGSELILQHGGKTSLGYPSSSHYISLNSVGVTLGRTNAAGINIGGLTVNNTDATFNSVNVQTYQGAPIGLFNYYMRNIGMGPSAKLTTDTDGLRGDIWIQYA